MMRYQDEIILSAHRGDRKSFPENTMPAFEAALELGCRMFTSNDIETARKLLQELNVRG